MDRFSGDMKKELECPVCLEFLKPPISICNNGHSVCTACRTQLVQCPTCKADFSNIKCIALEKIAEEMKVPGNNQASDTSKVVTPEVKLNTLSLDLARVLVCSECYNYLRSPIHLCRRNRKVCGPCWERVEHEGKCRYCSVEINEMKCSILKEIISKLIFPCFNQGKECPESGTAEEMRKHKVLCHWELPCPLKSRYCHWSGNWTEIKKHLSDKHADEIKCLEKNSITICNKIIRVVVSAFGSIFIYYHSYRDSTSHCVMVMMGTEQEASKYKCTLTMKAKNGVDSISETKLVRSLDITADGICNPCRCFVFDHNSHSSCLESNNITIGISPVD